MICYITEGDGAPVVVYLMTTIREGFPMAFIDAIFHLLLLLILIVYGYFG